MDYELTGSLVLLTSLTRVLVANNVISKFDLLADLARQQQEFPAPPEVFGQIRELVARMPDQ